MFLQAFMVLVAIAILMRLLYWQLFAGIEKRTIQTTSAGEIPAPRGDILTSDNFPLATNQEAYLMYVNPKILKDSPKKLAGYLAPLLVEEKAATMEATIASESAKIREDEVKKKEDELEQKLSNNKLYWVLLQRKIPAEVKNLISANNFQGIGFERDDKRFYPEASMASQVLGFVGSDKFGKDTGYFGLEGFYNNIIQGKPGRQNSNLDPKGLPILTGKFSALSPKKGSTLVTSIDRTIQFIAESTIREAVWKYGAKNGTVIIVNPKNGHVLAIATYPNYNPAFFQNYDQKLYQNLAVADAYEPGSTFKLVTMSSALDLNTVTPQTKCDVCSGPRKISGYEISTWDKKYYPNATMTEVIQHSDNVGMTFVSQKLGIEKFLNYITKFGFGEKTGIDLEEETSGSIRERRDWKEIDLATASFGQGLAVTPIQIVQAVSAVANGGLMVPPRVVEKVIEDGKSKAVKPAPAIQVISSQAATQMTEMLVNAVDKGEAQFFKPKGYRIAGKTGTAQIPVAGHYDPSKTVASFVGFAPAEDPRFVMLVRFTEPTSSIFGAETAAPTFFEIAREIFNYYGIPPAK